MSAGKSAANHSHPAPRLDPRLCPPQTGHSLPCNRPLDPPAYLADWGLDLLSHRLNPLGRDIPGRATEREEALARQFAAAGAALLWRHHPHVLQRAEWLDSPAGKTLVLYSLGNALFDQGRLANTRRSALALVRPDMNGVASAETLPFEPDILHSRVVEPAAETKKAILKQTHLAKPNFP